MQLKQTVYAFVILAILPSNLFGQSLEIEKELLRKSKSKTLSWANKQNPSTVEVLYIDDYSDSEFPNESILKFTNLKKLIVNARPMLERYNGDVFDPLQINIDLDKLKALPNLEHLHLSKFDFRVFPTSICRLNTLQILSINDCLVQSLPEEISNMTNLKGLSLSQNNLRKLPSSIMQLISLQVLDLGNNQFTEIPSNLLNMKSIEIINLANYKGVKEDPISWEWPVNLSVNTIDYVGESTELIKLTAKPNLKKIHVQVNDSPTRRKVKKQINDKVLRSKIMWQSIDCGCD